MSKLVYCGSSAWEWIGRKPPTDKKEAVATREYPGPVVFGPAENLNLTGIYTHCSSSHFVLIDDQGVAYTVGRNDKGQLGDKSNDHRTEPYPVPMDEKVIKAATGRGHTMLVTESGKLFAAGDNKVLQLGVGTKVVKTESKTFVQVPLKETIVDVACGADFTIALTDSGLMVSFGNPQYGQLGHGNDHEYIATGNKIVYDPQLPKRIALDAKIVSVSCGLNHTLALDATGALYVFGCNAYGRLGLNMTPPKDVMIPQEITGFKDRQNPIKKMAAGSSFSMLIDSRDALYVCGKWKNSGDGGQGTPWLYPKHFQGLSGWTVDKVSGGNNALFALADKCVISWGQGCNSGELGHGKENPRSATNAVKVEDLEGFNVLDVACGLGFTLLLVDDEKVSSLEVVLKDVKENKPKKDAKEEKPKTKKARTK